MAGEKNILFAVLQLLPKLVNTVAFSLRLLGNLFLALATEERCRLCTRYIDLVGWLSRIIPGDMVNPAHLEHINATSAAICHSCWQRLSSDSPIVSRFAVDEPKSEVLDFTSAAIDEQRNLLIFSGIGYTEPIKRLVRKFKYDKDVLLTRPLGSLLLTAWEHAQQHLTKDALNRNLILVPVPLHWRRRYERGYNQSALMAAAVGKNASIPVVEKALSRIKSTKPQNKLTKEARQDNLTHAFRGNEKLLRNKTVVLVDDVCTSGATLLECAREAYRCGASSVLALTVARAILMHKEVRQGELSNSNFPQNDSPIR